MSQMPIRQVQDNRLLRMGGMLDVTTRRAAGAAFETPMMTGLVEQQSALADARSGAYTYEQLKEHAAQTKARGQEVMRLENDLASETDPAKRDDILNRIAEIDQETSVAWDSMTRDSIAAGRMAPPDELAQQYGDLGLTFDRPMAVEEARILAENKRAEIIRNSIIEAGPDGFGPGMAIFGAGLAATAVDPLELASMFVPVVGEARMAILAAKFGRIGGRIAAGAIEGFVGSAVTEPIYYGLSRAQQLDYTMADALTNVGLGTVLGGAIGGVTGIFRRGDIPRTEAPTERIDPGLTREAGDISLRQFALGQSVDIHKLLDGTDLRGTTTLSRVGGIEFQATRTADIPSSHRLDTRPTILMQTAEGKARVFDTVQNAEVAAERTGGQVIAAKNGFVVRKPIEGDLVRDPFGKPVTFKSEREAGKFVASARALDGETSKPVPIMVSGRKVWAIARDMPPESVAEITRAKGDVQVPDGVNTRQKAVLPDASARMDQAVRGVVADTLTTKRLAKNATDLARDPIANVDAAARADVVSRETFDPTDTAEMETMVRQMQEAGDLPKEAAKDIAEIQQIESRAAAYKKATDAAVLCMVGAG